LRIGLFGVVGGCHATRLSRNAGIVDCHSVEVLSG
jgi:hypothetical protein